MSHDMPDDRSELSGLEGRLRGWRPAAGGLDRERMLFEAGRASARPRIGAAVPLVASCIVAAMVLALWANERTGRLSAEVALAREIEAHQASESLLAELRRGDPVTEGRAPAVYESDATWAALTPGLSRPEPSSYLVLSRRLDRGSAGGLASPVDSPSQGGSASEAPMLRVRDRDVRLDL